MINLLPSKEKRELNLERKKRLTIIFCFMGLLFFLTLGVIFISVNTYISKRVQYYNNVLQTKESITEQQEIRGMQEKIKEANLSLKKLKTFYNQRLNYSKLLERIAGILPENICLDDFSSVFTEPEKEKPYLRVSLSGFALTREDLFNLKRNLEKEENFQEIHFPPGNWMEARDINFSVNLKIIEK